MADQLHVFSSLPEQSLFSFPPTNVPEPIGPQPVPASVLRPFNIPDDWFKAALDPKVPLTIAALYAVSVKALNVYNSRRGKKAWAISKTRPFFAFVVVHNVFLAVYSAWTFWGMLGAMRRSIASPQGPQGLAATMDSFCRLHGSAGLANSIYYNETTSSFVSLAADAPLVNGLPSSTEPGRMWNEGLAFYGWLFYLSKFYEVLDTFIILAKGKLSSTLQTYHHAGAMLCMWAGMRYMSVPIWIFVLFNSFIHALMYFYYTITAFNFKVPTPIKRTLTSMQITQFLLGASSAMVHSFISYTMPVTVTRTETVQVDAPPPPAAPVLPKATGALDALKQLVFGAPPAEAPAPAASAPVYTETMLVSETTYITQPCIVTTGETFAIWINVFYLLPLTYLFVSFFIASYVKRSNAASKLGVPKGKDSSPRRLSNVVLAEKAGWDAAKGIEREVYGGEAMVNANANADSPANASADASADESPSGSVHGSAIVEDDEVDPAPKKAKSRRKA